MASSPLGYARQDRFDQYTGGYDTFNRVMGRNREYVPGYNPFTKHGLHQGYDKHRLVEVPDLTPLRASSPLSSSSHRVHESIVHEEPAHVQYGERVVKKLVQVPVTREVKVPAVIEKVVETREVKEFPVTKVKQEKLFKNVQEEYVDYEEREAVRMKEVWVKKEVPETYIERVPVKKTRTVEVPYTATKQYTEVQRVEVPVTKVVQEPGYRVDQVVELETREVEGKQKVEWIPRVVDEWTEERDLGVRDRHLVDRKVGQVVFPEHEHGVHYTSPTRQLYTSSVVSDVKSPGLFTSWDVRGDNHFGIYVKESVLGLVVKAVVPGSSAEGANIQVGDIINTVDGQEVFSIEEWRRTIGRKRSVLVGYRSKRLGRATKVQLTQ